MPELPEVESVRRHLEPHLVAVPIVDVEVRRPDLREPFPRRFRARLVGQTTLTLGRRAKHLLASLSSGETLVMHLGMSGSFRVSPSGDGDGAADPPAGSKHDHVVFHLASGAVITFNDPRRFGSMDLLTPARFADHPVLSRLGPEPLSSAFDAGVLAHACRRRSTSLKAALLDQRVVAGLGNIYASEALHGAGLSPRRRASSIATPTGVPREDAVRLAAAIKKVLADAIERLSDAPYRSAGFRVYDRAGKPCRRPRCGGTIQRLVQAGRSTYFCPVCQH